MIHDTNFVGHIYNGVYLRVQGGDELLLRLALTQALLEGRREAEALEEARLEFHFFIAMFLSCHIFVVLDMQLNFMS